MKIFTSWLILFALLQSYCNATINDQPNISDKPDKFCEVQLVSGTIYGNCSHPNYNAYTRIPYAKAPIKNLRFESPQPVEKWTGVRDATGKVEQCVQFSSIFQPLEGSEDCLYAYVYVPKGEKQPEVSHDPLITIVFMYPGSFQFGGPGNSPERIMEEGGSILVTFGYRIGPLGFLSTKDKRIPGNFGLKDQRLLIKWVEENIAAFGGDPNQILLLGNSAGAASVEMHMVLGSTKAKAYAVLSGSILNPWAFTYNPEPPAKEFSKLLNCSYNAEGNSLKECLQKKSITDIWKADIDMFKFYGFSTALFRPTVESKDVADAFLITDPRKLIKAGKYKDNVYLVGNVKGEGAFMAANLMQKNDNNTEVAEELNNRWQELCPTIFLYEQKSTKKQYKICKDLKRRYMCKKSFSLETYELIERMFSDEYFYNGIDKSVNWHRKAGQKVYRYIADMPTRSNIGNQLSNGRLDLCFGSVHTADAFGMMPIDLQFPKEELTKDERDTIYSLIRLMKSMVTDGTPKYKDTEIPANINNDKPDVCLRITYGEEHLGDCNFKKIDCSAPLTSIKCNK